MEYIFFFIFILVFLFGPATLYQLIESFVLSPSPLPRKEIIQLIAIRFATFIACYFPLFLIDNLRPYNQLLHSLYTPSIILLLLVFVSTILFMKPSKPKYIRMLLHFLSGILLFVISYNLFGAILFW